MGNEHACLHCKTSLIKKNYEWGKFCNNDCQAKYRRAQWMIENREKFEQGLLPTRAAIKKYVKERDGNQCSLCPQQAIHNGKELVMILDHIDGDASNNNPHNFRLVCPNCDTQLPTYKSKNYGKGRAARGLKWNSVL